MLLGTVLRTTRCRRRKKRLRMISNRGKSVSFLNVGDGGGDDHEVELYFCVQVSGSSPLLIPLANYATPSITRSNRANRVTALGFSANQSATRTTFIAQAVSKCCKPVFSNPKYLERRNP